MKGSTRKMQGGLLVLLFGICFVFAQVEPLQAQSSVQKKKKKGGEEVAFKNSDFYTFRNELGINTTQLLANIFSLNANADPNPYNLIYRRHLKSSSFRTGMQFAIEQDQQEDFSNGSFIIRKLNKNQVTFRMGLEKHIPAGKRWMFSYGADVLAGLNLEESDVSENNQTGTVFFTSSDRATWFGGGPVLRFDFKISDRMLLSTESSMYATYRKTTSEISINGIPSEDPSSSAFQFLLALPQSLYFNVCF